MFISLKFCSYILQIMCHVFKLSLTHASRFDPIPSIADIRKYNVIEITSMCYDDNTTHLDYEAIRHHLRLRYLEGELHKYNEHWGGDIGFSSYDVCNDPKRLRAVLTKLILSKQFRWRLLSWPEYSCFYGRYQWNFLYIMSFMNPYMTRIAADILESTEILYFASIDYRGLDTSPLIVTNENMFTFDNTFYSDVNIILDFIDKYHIKHMLLLYSNRDEQSSRSFHQEQIWEQLIKIPDICVDIMDLTNSSSKKVSSLIEYIKERNQIKLIMVFPKITISSYFVNQIKYIDDRIWIWYPEKFFPYQEVIKSKSSCHFVFLHFLYYQLPSTSKYVYKNMSSRLLRKSYTSILNDIWIKRFNAEKRFNLSSKDIFNHFDVNKTRIGELIDLLPSYPFQRIDIYSYHPIFRGDIRHSFNSMRIVLISGNTCNSTTVGDEDSTIIVKNIYHRGPVLHCKPVKCPPGNEPVKTIFTKTGFVKNFGWTCKKCPSDKVKLNYSTDNCISCPGRTIPDKDLINCFDPYTDEFLTFIDYKSMIILSILIPFLTYNMGLIFIFSFRRKTPIIVASGSTSNLFQLSAHLLISIELLVLFFGKLNDTKCTFQVITTGTLFTLILSLLLTQTQKTLYVFKAKIQISRNDVILTKVVQIFVSVTLIAIQILISAISYIQLMPTVMTTIDKKHLKRKVACNNELFFRVHFVYILILAILCSIQALRARNLPKYFTATAEIGYSMYITVVVIMVRFPILSSEQVDDKNFANVLFIIVLNSIPMVIRYTNTCYTLIFHPEKNTKEYVRNILLKNVRQKTEEKIAERNRQNTGEENNEDRINKDK